MYTTLKFIGTPLVSVTETPLRVYWDTLRGSLTTIVDKTPQGVFNKETFFNCAGMTKSLATPLVISLFRWHQYWISVNAKYPYWYTSISNTASSLSG